MKRWNLDGLRHHAKERQELGKKQRGKSVSIPEDKPCLICDKSKGRNWHDVMEDHEYKPE